MKSYANTERKLSKIVVSNIKFFRIKAGLSEEELSIKIGKKENFIKRLENLEFKRGPTTDLLDRIGKVLKIEAQEFLLKGNNFMNDIETLYERIEEEFDELISDVQKKLIETDASYKKIYNLNKNLRKKYPSLLKIYESDNPGTLNEEEINALITMLSNELKLKYIEHKKMFMLGSKEAYYYFKNMDMLKEEDAKK